MKTNLVFDVETRCSSLSGGGDNHNGVLFTLRNTVDRRDGTSTLVSERVERRERRERRSLVKVLDQWIHTRR